MPQTALKEACNNFFGSTSAQTKGLSSQLRVLGKWKSALNCRKSDGTCPNQENARPTLSPFYKQCMKKAINMPQTALKQAWTNFFGSTSAQTKRLSSQLSVPGNGKSALNCGKSDRTCPNRADARPTLPPFYKQFMKKAINMSQTALKQAWTNFFGSTSAQTKGLSSQLRVPGNGKSALNCGKSDRTCPNRANARPTLPPFYKQCMKKAINMRQTALKQAWTNFFGSTSAQNKGLSSQFRVPGNGKSALNCGKWDRTYRNRADTRPNRQPFYKLCMKKTINIGQTALKQACTNFFWEHFSANQGHQQLAQDPWQWEISFKLWKIGQTCPNRAKARSTLEPFYKKWMKKAINLLQTALKQGCNNFFGSSPAQSKSLSSQLRVPGNGKSVSNCEKSDRTCPNRANARPTLSPFYKQCMKKEINMRQTALKEAYTNFFGRSPA